MRTLLVSPYRPDRPICGDDIVTRLLLDRPPEGVSYTHHDAALAAGELVRTRPARAWLASLAMHSRPPAGVDYTWPALPPWPYRLLGRLMADRPDEDVQWLGLKRPEDFDLVHAFAHPLHLAPRRASPPVVMHCGCGNTDLLLNYYQMAPATAARLARRDRALLGALGVHHDLYATERVKRVIVPSAYGRQIHLDAGVPEEKIAIVRFGFETPALPPPREPDGTFRFTLVGHQFWRKGGKSLVTAFDRLRRLHPEARLTIVSRVEPAELGISLEGITLIGELPREGIYTRIYPESDVYLLPSLAEGYGMSVVEAMSFGLPVIASRLGALGELVADGETGLLVEPGDAETLYEAMKRLMEDPALARRMGTAGRARFDAEHAVEVTNRSLLSVYRDALGA